MITRTRSVFIGTFGMKKGGKFFFFFSFFFGIGYFILEAHPVPDEERGSSVILGAGVLGVPRENSGSLS